MAKKNTFQKFRLVFAWILGAGILLPTSLGLAFSWSSWINAQWWLIILLITSMFLLGESITRSWKKLVVPRGAVNIVTLVIASIILYNVITGIAFLKMLSVPLLQGANAVIFALAGTFVIIQAHVD